MPQAIVSSLNLYRALQNTAHMDSLRITTDEPRTLNVGGEAVGCEHRGEFDFYMDQETSGRLRRILQQVQEQPITISCNKHGGDFSIQEIYI